MQSEHSGLHPDTSSLVKFLKTNFDSFIEGSSDPFLLVYVNILLRVEIIVFQKRNKTARIRAKP